MNRTGERALALGGLLQACHLVNSIARSGLVGQDSLAGSLETIFVTNPENTADIYRGGNGVRTGLRLLMEIVEDGNIADHGDAIRYALALLKLEKRLRRMPDLMREIGAGISAVHEHRNLHELEVSNDIVVEKLSQLYEQTVGSLEPRIRVLGTQKHLKNTLNTQRIRALLLSGLRSAVLWRQLDGTMLQLVLGRRRLLSAAHQAAEFI